MYSGNHSRTQSDGLCKRWGKKYDVHRQNATREIPEPNVTEGANFCRNPNGRTGGPWCYTSASNSTWEYCNIAICGQSEYYWALWIYLRHTGVAHE